MLHYIYAPTQRTHQALAKYPAGRRAALCTPGPRPQNGRVSEVAVLRGVPPSWLKTVDQAKGRSSLAWPCTSTHPRVAVLHEVHVGRTMDVDLPAVGQRISNWWWRGAPAWWRGGAPVRPGETPIWRSLVKDRTTCYIIVLVHIGVLAITRVRSRLRVPAIARARSRIGVIFER